MDGYGARTYGDGFADVYDDWYGDVSPVEDTVAFVRERTDGLVVEFGSGTGRIAEPLRRAGATVVGLDASLAMLRRSVANGPELPVVAADMTQIPFRSGVASLVLITFNTLFNLPSASLQQRALREAGELLGDGGRVVIEAFVPGDGTTAPDERVEVVRLDADAVVLRVSRNDPSTTSVSGHHIELRDGEPVRLRPWHLRYTDPDGIDRLAESAGLTCVGRYADWSRAPFDAASQIHVSVFEQTEDPG